MADNINKPLFESAHQALTFAFNVRPKADLCTIYGKGEPMVEGKGLGGLDGPAQAGMILAMVNRLPSRLHQHILVARFAPRTHPCSCRSACCIGYRNNETWIHSMMFISDDIKTASLKTKTSASYSLRRELVHKFFGKVTTIQKVAEDCGVNRDTASDHWRVVNEYLKNEMHRADCEISDVLHTTNIIEFAAEKAA